MSFWQELDATLDWINLCTFHGYLLVSRYISNEFNPGFSACQKAVKRPMFAVTPAWVIEVLIKLQYRTRYNPISEEVKDRFGGATQIRVNMEESEWP